MTGAAAPPEGTSAEPFAAGPTRPGLLRTLEALAILGAIAFALVFWARLPGRLPSEADYLAVQKTLTAEVQPGDGVALVPFWADRGKLFLHGLPIVALPDLEADAERYPRLWLLAQPELPRSDAARTLRALDERLVPRGEARRFGPLSLSLYEPRPGRAATLDLTAHLAEAEVSIGGSSPVACVRAGNGFQCPRGGWNHVAPEWHEFDELPRRCLWAHPVGEEPLSIAFAQAPIHGGLRGGFGLVGQAALLPNAAPVDLAVRIDGALVASLELAPGDPGWHPFELDLPGLAGRSHALALEVTSPNPGMRHFCVDAVAF